MLYRNFVVVLSCLAITLISPVTLCAQKSESEYNEFVNNLRKSAERGNAVDQCTLGTLYFNNKGNSEESAESIKWFRMAAEQGYAQGQFMMGLIYSDGRLGVPRNYAESAKWYRMAAEQGEPLSQFYLGMMTSLGDGVLKDYVSAYMWLSLSSAQGYAAAIKGLDMIAAKMSSAQIAEAQRLAAAWRPKKK